MSRVADFLARGRALLRRLKPEGRDEASATWRRILARPAAYLRRDAGADRVVPPAGFTAILTVFTAAAMAFLATFALALTAATGRLADRWGAELSQTATIRIAAPAEAAETQVAEVLAILGETPGVAEVRAMTQAEQRALLAPYFGPELPVDALDLPRLVEVRRTATGGFDAEGLRQRLAAAVPDATLDDHSRWRAPLVDAAGRVRRLGLLSLGLIAAATAAMVTLAASVALAANAQVISVLRLVGARDGFIARAFVRRFTLRAAAGGAAGTGLGLVALALMPGGAAGVLPDLGLRGSEWLLPLVIPPVAAGVAFAATRAAAMRRLGRMP